jgi:hypothetical protein
VAGKLTHVSVQMGAGHNLLSVAQFLLIPLGERVELVMTRRVQFLDEHGQPIPAREAMPQLSKALQAVR